MPERKKSALILAPFWRVPGHVGNYRVDRFRRWLVNRGYKVTIVRAGDQSRERELNWGKELTIQDLLGLYPEHDAASSAILRRRKPNKIRASLASWFFNPDPTIVWARSAARNQAVIEEAKKASLILSSSPPESAHVGAWLISRKVGTPQLMDMRDGWLDEPLRPVLREYRIRQWWEGRLEKKIVEHSKAIQVTSETWKTDLCERYDGIEQKVWVLTNAYPKRDFVGQPRLLEGKKGRLTLVHAGRFLASRVTQSPDLLLAALLRNIKSDSASGVIKLIGPISDKELSLIRQLQSQFKAEGWEIECPGVMPREDLLQLIEGADGLLLLSAARAALPSKLFEYIPTGKPILVVTEKESACWQLCARLPQATLVDISDTGTIYSGSVPFYRSSCSTVPMWFSEEWLEQQFARLLREKFE